MTIFDVTIGTRCTDHANKKDINAVLVRGDIYPLNVPNNKMTPSLSYIQYVIFLPKSLIQKVK